MLTQSPLGLRSRLSLTALARGVARLAKASRSSMAKRSAPNAGGAKGKVNGQPAAVKVMRRPAAAKTAANADALPRVKPGCSDTLTNKMTKRILGKLTPAELQSAAGAVAKLKRMRVSSACTGSNVGLLAACSLCEVLGCGGVQEAFACEKELAAHRVT